jgi:hypothetical protein
MINEEGQVFNPTIGAIVASQHHLTKEIHLSEESRHEHRKIGKSAPPRLFDCWTDVVCPGDAGWG